VKNEREATAYPGLEIDRHANQLYFGSDTDPNGNGRSVPYSAVAVFGAFRARMNGQLQPGVAMSVRTNDDHPEVTAALIDTLRHVADELEKALPRKVEVELGNVKV
jgi:hypothetical protein